MNLNRVISTAVLFLLLGTTFPVFAQKGQEKKGGGKANVKQSHQQQSKHVKRVERKTRRTQRSQPAVAQKQGNNGFHGNGNNGNHYGRISDDHYRAHFGRDHSFRMVRPRMIKGYNRFQYSGYWFGYNQPWPSNWNRNDNVYVEYVGGGYYLYNPRHSGVRITLNLF
ncbi:MAG TPA: hypothetical protein VMW54_12980 [Terriglobia bacterium]|nr:hypothetical protein [Terriglobia bacterium]